MNKAYENSSMLQSKLATDAILKDLLKLMLKDKNVSSTSYSKMAEILAFNNRFFKKSKLYEIFLNHYLKSFNDEHEKESQSFKSIFILILNAPSIE
jgi:hypothetical protein